MFSFFSMVLSVLIVGHLVAYKTFVSLFKEFAQKYLFWVRAVFVLLSVSFLGVISLSRDFDSLLISIFYTASATWIGFLLYIVLASILYSLVWLVNRLFNFNLPVVWIGRGLLIVALLVGSYGVYHANDLKVTEYTVTVSDLPEAWEGRRAVFLADMHLGPVRKSGFSKKVAEKIKELQPEIVFDAGDLYDGGFGNAFALIEPLADLNIPLGYYFATGNHEEYGDINAFRLAIAEAGILVLNNEAVEIDGVRIVGADYATTRSAENLSFALREIPKDEMPTILIKHVPFDLSTAEELGIDFQLSGHTHRAQVFPLNYITRAVYKGYYDGLKKFGKMQVLVTDGVGTWGPPLRVGTNSELVLLTFHSR